MTALVKRQVVELETIESLQRFAKMAIKSGFFRCGKSETPEAAIARAALTVTFGKELGMGPATALKSLYVINGVVAMKAELVAATIKGSKKYDYRVKNHSDETCEIEFFEGVESLGSSEFSMQHAKNAGLSSNPNYKKWPKAMLFARAITQGARWYCADLFLGSIYTPDEIEAGDFIDVEPVVSEPAVDPAESATDIPQEDLPTAIEAPSVKQLFRLESLAKDPRLSKEYRENIARKLVDTSRLGKGLCGATIKAAKDQILAETGEQKYVAFEELSEEEQALWQK